VSMSSGARFPAFFWGLWQRDASALPRVFIRARACPASTRHQFQRMGKKVWDGQFASLVLTNRRAVLQAQAELKQLCARYVPESLDGSAEPRTIAEVIAAQRAAVAERPADEPGTGAVGSQVT
jgi:hypothetical protein